MVLLKGEVLRKRSDDTAGISQRKDVWTYVWRI